jgi:hypothetical protein
MDRKVRVVEVVFTREVPFQFKLMELGLEFMEVLLALVEQSLIMPIFQELVKGEEILVVLLELREEIVIVLQPGKARGNIPRFIGFIPKAGLGGLGLKLIYFPLVVSGVKDNPSLR